MNRVNRVNPLDSLASATKQLKLASTLLKVFVSGIAIYTIIANVLNLWFIAVINIRKEALADLGSLDKGHIYIDTFRNLVVATVVGILLYRMKRVRDVDRERLLSVAGGEPESRLRAYVPAGFRGNVYVNPAEDGAFSLLSSSETADVRVPHLTWFEWDRSEPGERLTPAPELMHEMGHLGALDELRSRPALLAMPVLTGLAIIVSAFSIVAFSFNYGDRSNPDHIATLTPIVVDNLLAIALYGVYTLCLVRIRAQSEYLADGYASVNVSRDQMLGWLAPRSERAVAGPPAGLVQVLRNGMGFLLGREPVRTYHPPRRKRLSSLETFYDRGELPSVRAPVRTLLVTMPILFLWLTLQLLGGLAKVVYLQTQ